MKLVNSIIITTITAFFFLSTHEIFAKDDNVIIVDQDKCYDRPGRILIELESGVACVCDEDAKVFPFRYGQVGTEEGGLPMCVPKEGSVTEPEPSDPPISDTPPPSSKTQRAKAFS